VTLDEWSDDEIDSMTEVGGNSSANAIYEAFLPEGVSKPGPDSSHEERMRFIRLEMTCLSNPNLSFFFSYSFFLPCVTCMDGLSLCYGRLDLAWCHHKKVTDVNRLDVNGVYTLLFQLS
jgi:hypothetical protein